MMLGARGFPGNSISHPNSFFVPEHNTRVFLDGECDFVSSIGYNPARLPKGHSLDDIDIRLVVTDLCVMDFGGPQHQIRLVSLHPGITAEQVQANTGYPVYIPETVPTTTAPTRGATGDHRRAGPAQPARATDQGQSAGQPCLMRGQKHA